MALCHHKAHSTPSPGVLPNFTFKQGDTERRTRANKPTLAAPRWARCCAPLRELCESYVPSGVQPQPAGSRLRPGQTATPANCRSPPPPPPGPARPGNTGSPSPTAASVRGPRTHPATTAKGENLRGRARSGAGISEDGARRPGRRTGISRNGLGRDKEEEEESPGSGPTGTAAAFGDKARGGRGGKGGPRDRARHVAAAAAGGVWGVGVGVG